LTHSIFSELESLQRRDAERAALLRRHGFSDLAAVYARGSEATSTRLRSLARSVGEDRPTQVPRDPWTGTALPQRDRMRALTSLVRTDMSENRAWSRTLRRIAERRDGVIGDAAAATAGRVAEQTEELNDRLRARLSRWATRGDA
jgi:hypothetical protein